MIFTKLREIIAQAPLIGTELNKKDKRSNVIEYYYLFDEVNLDGNPEKVYYTL